MSRLARLSETVSFLLLQYALQYVPVYFEYPSYPELGTRQHCRDNVTMISGHKIVGYCIMSIFAGAAQFSGQWSSITKRCRCREAKQLSRAQLCSYLDYLWHCDKIRPPPGWGPGGGGGGGGGGAQGVGGGVYGDPVGVEDGGQAGTKQRQLRQLGLLGQLWQLEQLGLPSRTTRSLTFEHLQNKFCDWLFFSLEIPAYFVSLLTLFLKSI